MKKISIVWAVASIAILATACTVTTETDNGDAGGTSGAAGAGGTSGAGGSTAGAAGSDASTADAPAEAAACVKSSTAGACETCSFDNCGAELCACWNNADCSPGIPTLWTCMSDSNNNPEDCAANFVVAAGNDGAIVADDLGTCMVDVNAGCIDTCAPTTAEAGTPDAGTPDAAGADASAD